MHTSLHPPPPPHHPPPHHPPPPPPPPPHHPHHSETMTHCSVWSGQTSQKYYKHFFSMSYREYPSVQSIGHTIYTGTLFHNHMR